MDQCVRLQRSAILPGTDKIIGALFIKKRTRKKRVEEIKDLQRKVQSDLPCLSCLNLAFYASAKKFAPGLKNHAGNGSYESLIDAWLA